VSRFRLVGQVSGHKVENEAVELGREEADKLNEQAEAGTADQTEDEE
jgi:hypothetical protein